VEHRARTAFWLVAASAALLLFAKLGSVPLLDPDEARFARTTVEMVRGGNYVVPTFEGKPRLVKPPLLHWIQATLFRYFGPSELGARLPSTLATLGSMLLLAWALRRRFGDEAAAWSAAIFVTMPLVFILGKAGTLDALLSVHVFAALCFDLAAAPEERGARGAAIGALLGLGFLVKGPVGVVLPLLVMLAGRTACRREVLPTLRGTLSALAAWAVVVLPWGLAFLKSVGGGTAAGTIRHEALERYFGGTAHIEPPWFYAQIVAVGCLPWTGPLAVAVARLIRRREEEASKTALYAGAGLAAGLLFFSLGKGKLPNYLLPLAPLAAVLVTWELGQELWEPRKKKVGSILVSVTLFLMCVVLAVVRGKGDHPELATALLAASLVFGIGAAAALAGVLLHKPRITYGAGALAMAAFFGTALAGVPSFVLASNSAAALVERTPQLRSGRPVVVLDRELPSLTFYLDRIPEKALSKDLEERMNRGDDPLFVSSDRDWNDLPEEAKAGVREVNRAGKLVVFELGRESGANSPP
jgi:4-amino-4-deoxy-L-arabinose transferase-like glycosyltransferase